MQQEAMINVALVGVSGMTYVPIVGGRVTVTRAAKEREGARVSRSTGGAFVDV